MGHIRQLWISVCCIYPWAPGSVVQFPVSPDHMSVCPGIRHRKPVVALSPMFNNSFTWGSVTYVNLFFLLLLLLPSSKPLHVIVVLRESACCSFVSLCSHDPNVTVINFTLCTTLLESDSCCKFIFSPNIRERLTQEKQVSEIKT